MAIDDRDVRQRIIVIGDAGLPGPCRDGRPDCPFDPLPLLTAWAGREVTLDGTTGKVPTFVLFVGDKVYEVGQPGPTGEDCQAASKSERCEAEGYLRSQYRVLMDSGARGMFVPGNHD